MIVRTLACDECSRAAAKQPSWSAKVQLRQRADHPRTLLAIEQYLKRQQRAKGVTEGLLSVSQVSDGLDFGFARRQGARRFVNALCAIAPCRVRHSTSVVSTNVRQGTSNVQHVWIVEVPSIARDDIVLAPLAGNAGGRPQKVAIVTRVGAAVHFVDPQIGSTWEISAEAYWREPFAPLASRRHQTRFTVLDCEVEDKGSRGSGRHQAQEVLEWSAAEATVARNSDFGANDDTFLIRTHLGKQLEAGDEVMGYDLLSMPHLDIPNLAQDVVLVSKARNEVPAGTPQRGKQRRRARRSNSSKTGESKVSAEDEIFDDEELEFHHLEGALLLSSMDEASLDSDEGVVQVV